VNVKVWFSFLTLVAAVVSVSSVNADFDDFPDVAKPVQTAAPAPAANANPTPEAARSTPSQSGKDSNAKDTGSSGRPASSKAPAAKPAQQQPAQNNNEEMEHNSSAPVAYSAQSLEGSLTAGRILLKGNVEIEQADAIMKSDVAEIFSKKGESTPQRAVAKGRVSLYKAANATNQELRAVANELEYFIRNRKVILKGKPKIWRGRELLQGEIIEVFLDTNEIKVRGARGVMEPAAGNPPGGGVQNPPAKKSSQTGRR
jgi:lipopolysaccharide transport protein LptA